VHQVGFIYKTLTDFYCFNTKYTDVLTILLVYVYMCYLKTLYTFVLHTVTESEFISRFRESKKGQVTKFLTVKTNIIHYIWNSDINIWREGAHKLGRKDYIQYFTVSKTVPTFNSHLRPTKCTTCLCQLSVKFILTIIHTFTNVWVFRFSQRCCWRFKSPGMLQHGITFQKTCIFTIKLVQYENNEFLGLLKRETLL
jgi:hypothetical protein